MPIEQLSEDKLRVNLKKSFDYWKKFESKEEIEKTFEYWLGYLACAREGELITHEVSVSLNHYLRTVKTCTMNNLKVYKE